MSERDSTQPQKETEIVTADFDPANLSEETVRELREKDLIDTDEVEAYKDNIYVKNVTPEESPTKTSVGDRLVTWYKTVSKKVSGGVSQLLQKRSTLPSTLTEKLSKHTPEGSGYYTITDVKPNRSAGDDDITLIAESCGVTKKFDINSEETQFANLLEYHNCQNAEELIGEKIIRSYPILEENVQNECLLPHNTSTLGTIRYKLYGILSHLRTHKILADSILQYLPAIAGGLCTVVLFRFTFTSVTPDPLLQQVDNGIFALLVLLTMIATYGLLVVVFEIFVGVGLKSKFDKLRAR